MADQVKDASFYGIVNKPVILPVKCGSCIFLRRMATYPKPCSQLGILPESPPCRRYASDPAKVKIWTQKELLYLFDVIGSVDKKYLPYLADLAWQESKSRKQKNTFRLGQKVMVHILGGDYISNYAKGVVVGTMRETVGNEKDRSISAKKELIVKRKRVTKECVLIQGKQGWTGKYYSNDVMTMEAWAAKKETLIKKNAINDPKSPFAVIAKKKLPKYEPPTIDSKLDQKVSFGKKKKGVQTINVR